MTSRASRLLDDALSLPETDRAEIAARLIDSLDEGFDEDADTAWESEIRRRISQMDDGEVKAMTWPEVRRMILHRSRAGRG